MTHTPMTPEMWEEAMKHPERYMIADSPLVNITGVTRCPGFGGEITVYSVSIDNEQLPKYVNSSGTRGFISITRRPDAPPMVSQAAELGSALVSKKSTDFQMPITKADAADIANSIADVLSPEYTHNFVAVENAYRDRLAELIPHYYIAEMHLDGALISIRLEVVGMNKVYTCITDDRKTGIMYILLKVLEDAK